MVVRSISAQIVNILYINSKKLWLKSIVTSILCIFTSLATSANTQPVRQTDNLSSKWVSQKTSTTTNRDREPLDFSGTGRPGQQTAGESRGDCPPVNPPLTALLPASHSGTTVNEYPTFWFYVPYNAEQVDAIEFVLQNEQRQDVYRTSLSLKKTPGYLHLSLPATASPLEVGEWYVWYFKIYCAPPEVSTPLFVQGWIKRVTINSFLNLELQQTAQRLDKVYARYGIWYDAVDRLARLHLFNPTNQTLRQDWYKLLNTKGVSLEELNSTVLRE